MFQSLELIFALLFGSLNQHFFLRHLYRCIYIILDIISAFTINKNIVYLCCNITMLKKKHCYFISSDQFQRLILRQHVYFLSYRALRLYFLRYNNTSIVYHFVEHMDLISMYTKCTYRFWQSPSVGRALLAFVLKLTFCQIFLRCWYCQLF